MQELFVGYEQALKLRSLGFDEECLARYCVVTEWEKPTGEVRLQISSDCPNNHKTLLKAPLWGQAFDWLFNTFSYNCTITNNMTFEQKENILNEAIRDIQNNLSK